MCNSAHPYKMLAKQRCYEDYFVKEIDVDDVRRSWPAVSIFMKILGRVFSAGDIRQLYQSHISEYNVILIVMTGSYAPFFRG